MNTSGTAMTTTMKARAALSRASSIEHDQRRDPVDHEEDGAPADEAADGADVARGAREQLPGVPVVVEPHVESLELRVQVVAERGLHAVGDDPEHVATDERCERLDDAEEERETGQRGDSRLVTVGERAVDHRLRHQRNGDGRDQADERDPGHDDERAAVRAQVRQDATKTSVTHGSPRANGHPPYDVAGERRCDFAVVCRRWRPGGATRSASRPGAAGAAPLAQPLARLGWSRVLRVPRVRSHADHRGRRLRARGRRRRRPAPGAQLRGRAPARGRDVHPVAGHADREGRYHRAVDHRGRRDPDRALERVGWDGGAGRRDQRRPRSAPGTDVREEAGQGPPAHARRGRDPERDAVPDHGGARAAPRRRSRDRRASGGEHPAVAGAGDRHDRRPGRALPRLGRAAAEGALRHRHAGDGGGNAGVARRIGVFAFYTANFARYSRTYGSLASIVVVLLWLYLSAFAVLLGAEVDGAID